MVKMMKKVSRGAIPTSLRQNAAVWTKELLNEIAKVGLYTKVEDRYKDRYKQRDVQKALEQMYFGKCCYCEQMIGAESYEQIEHLRPKSNPKFHDLTFEWNNLHWCCQRCNTAKGKLWDEKYPIIDPTIDNPNEHLYLNLVNGEIEHYDLRGKTTISHAKLNRENLLKARKRTLRKLNELELTVKRTQAKEDDVQLINMLNIYVEDEEEFSSLISQYIRKMQEDL